MFAALISAAHFFRAAAVRRRRAGARRRIHADDRCRCAGCSWPRPRAIRRGEAL